MAPLPPQAVPLPRTGGGAVNVDQSHFAFAHTLGTFSHTTCYPIGCVRWTCLSDRVSKWHAIGVTIGALTVQFTIYVIKEFSLSWRPFHRKRSPSPAPAGEALGSFVA